MRELSDWKNRSREETIELCQLYSDYVTQSQYRESYRDAVGADRNPLKVEYRLSMASFLLIHLMDANPWKTAEVFQRSPHLEGPDVLKAMLLSQTNDAILSLLLAYDRYIVGLDDHCSGNDPVCLDEFLSSNYGFCLLEHAYGRFEQQHDNYKTFVSKQGAVANHDRNATNLYVLDWFNRAFRQFCEKYTPDSELLEAAEKLAGSVRKEELIDFVCSRVTPSRLRPSHDDSSMQDLFMELCRELTTAGG